MKQLTGLDAGFLYMETPTTFGHTASLSIYEKPSQSGEAPYALFMAQVESRLGLLEPFRRRLVDVPFQLDHPWWIEDPSFDLDFHIRHIAVPPPAGDDELADLVGRIIGRPLDRARPLWEAYVIEGLADGRWALAPQRCSPLSPETPPRRPEPSKEPIMPIDPQAQSVLDFFENAITNGASPMWEMSPTEARASYETANKFRGPGEQVDSVVDQTVPGPAGDIPIRIYRPGPGIRPALVFFHGGGFVIGSIDSHDREIRRLANRSDAVVISVDYRLAPEAPFPAATDDAWAALTWTRENAASLDIDPSRLAVGGDSAGGNLAAVTAIRARDEGMELRHQLLVYPAVDISDGVDDRYPSRRENDGYVLSTQLNEWFIGHYVGGDSIPDDPRLTPIAIADHSRLAPALVLTAEYDPLRDEGAAYADALRSAGVPVTHSQYPGQIHGFFNLAPTVAAGTDAVDEAAAVLAAAFAS